MGAHLKKGVESICDDNGIEVLVGYLFEQSESQVEETHGLHEVGLIVYTELRSVEVLIAGTGIDILPRLSDKQKEHIISKLQYE